MNNEERVKNINEEEKAYNKKYRRIMKKRRMKTESKNGENEKEKKN